MNCSIIKDLLPLYVDNCCSEETMDTVSEHLKGCPACSHYNDELKKTFINSNLHINKKVGLKKVHERRASMLQLLMLMLSFLTITIGVALEAATPTTGFSNGMYAFAIVVPAAGFLLSIANYFFIREYRSAKQFSTGTLISTISITLIAFVWTAWHYEMLPHMFFGISYDTMLIMFSALHAIILCIISYVCASYYAKWVGKE